MIREVLKDVITCPDRQIWIKMLNHARDRGWTVRVVSYREGSHWAELYKVIYHA